MAEETRMKSLDERIERLEEDFKKIQEEQQKKWELNAQNHAKQQQLIQDQFQTLLDAINRKNEKAKPPTQTTTTSTQTTVASSSSTTLISTTFSTISSTPQRILTAVSKPGVRAVAVESVDVSIEKELIEKSVNSIRFLAVDAVEKENSGHPGLPMGCAPIEDSSVHNEKEQELGSIEAKVFEENQVEDFRILSKSTNFTSPLHKWLWHADCRITWIYDDKIDIHLERNLSFDVLGFKTGRNQLKVGLMGLFQLLKYGGEWICSTDVLTLETKQSDMFYLSEVEIEFYDWKGGTELQGFITDRSLLFGNIVFIDTKFFIGFFIGLNGPRSFISKYPWSTLIRMVVDSEGMGNGERFGTSQASPSLWSIEKFALAAIYPSYNVIAHDFFASGLIKFATYFQIYKKVAGLLGLQLLSAFFMFIFLVAMVLYTTCCNSISQSSSFKPRDTGNKIHDWWFGIQLYPRFRSIDLRFFFVLYKLLGGSIICTLFQWLFAGGGDCRIASWCFSLKAYVQRLLDFSATYFGVALICPYIINNSLFFGANISWGITWSAMGYKKGENEESLDMERTTWTDFKVKELVSKYCVLLHIEQGIVDATNFSVIYSQKSIPCVTEIGQNRIQLGQSEGFVGPEVLVSSLETAWLSLHIQENTAFVLAAALASKKHKQNASGPSGIGSNAGLSGLSLHGNYGYRIFIVFATKFDDGLYPANPPELLQFMETILILK